MNGAGTTNSIIEAIASPVGDAASEPARLTDGIALCLSGGGYRAMLFHLGALWRLNELGWLQKLERISSVSGGSITNGVLGLGWNKLAFDDDGVATRFNEVLTEPLRSFASRTVDIRAVLAGIFTSDSAADWVADAYDTHLFHEKTLQDLPDEQRGRAPRFVFNAANVQSGVLFRFAKPYVRDYRVGEIRKPKVKLSQAVAASSAFPPVLSPLTLDFSEADFTPDSGTDLQTPPYTTKAILTDGGVYDNLGLETTWKRYRTILVSDGGGRMGAQPAPRRNWLLHTKRVLDLIDSQVRALRKRQVIGAFQLPRDSGSAWRSGTYWGIHSNIADYGLGDSLPCPHELTRQVAAEPTRLAKIPAVRQERIINWGYAVCDTAMRRWVIDGPSPRPRFPYESAGVG